MTENNKRFVIEEFFDNDDVLNSHIHMIDEIDGKIYSNSWICFKKVCELCNQLNDENKVLKATNGEMEDYLARIEEEVQQLKKENKGLKDLLKSITDRNNEIWLANGQIIRLTKVFKGEWTNESK